MVVSKRERIVIITAAVAIAALGLDRFVLDPLLEGRSQAQSDMESTTADIGRASATLQREHDLAAKWHSMLDAGIKSQPAEAESQVLHAVRDWAEECGVTLSLLKPDRSKDKTLMPKVTLQASGTGSMEAIAKLLWQVQNAKIPLRITDLQLASRKEGADDLNIQLRLSTIYLPSASSPKPTAATRNAEVEP